MPTIRPTKVPAPVATQEPPTMPGHPIIGSALALRKRLLATQERAMRELGDVVRFTAGPPGARIAIYSIFAPDGVQQVLTARTDYRKDNRLYREVRATFGDGLLTSQDEVWLRQKRFLQPLFVRSQMQAYGGIITDESAALADRWRVAANTGEPVPLHSDMIQYTVRVVGRILFGLDLAEMIRLIQVAVPALTAEVFDRGFAPVNLPRSWPTPANNRRRRILSQLYRAIDSLIADRRQQSDTGNDMLGLLTRPGIGVSDAEVRDQLLIFLLAGHDTTAGALAAALHLLGSHPEAQDRAVDEVRQVLAGRPATADDVPQLPYLGQVFKEALRLYPPAYGISRRVEDGDVVSGYRIPPGSDVAVFPWCTHRHPRFWDDPERFDPDRFTPEREAARHHYAWFPFGGGPRACIGAQLSTLEAVIALASVLQSYRLSTTPGPIPVIPRITLHPAAQVMCRLAIR